MHRKVRRERVKLGNKKIFKRESGKERHLWRKKRIRLNIKKKKLKKEDGLNTECL